MDRNELDPSVPSATEVKKIPLIIKVYAVLCILSGVSTLPSVAAFMWQVITALINGNAAAKLGDNTLVAVGLIVAGIMLSAASAVILIIFGLDLIKNQRRNAARLPLCEILREGTGEGYCWYDMTYSGSAVGLFRYIHSNPPGKSAAILRSVLRALDEQLYRPTARPADPEKIEEYLNKKMDANLEKIRDARILKELWNYDRIWINGRSYRNLKELGRLFDHNALRTLFAADPVADIHGDLTVENIICRTDVENPDKAWYIIDPNTGNLHDSPYLDYGKLLQSLHGGYEFMMMTPRCTVQENHIDFQLTRSAAYDTLFEAVCDDLRARCGAAGLHSILAHELIHWLRLMPYKLNKDKKRAPMFYAGLVMVANDLNTWENEGKFDEKARTDRR